MAASSSSSSSSSFSLMDPSRRKSESMDDHQTPALADSEFCVNGSFAFFPPSHSNRRTHSASRLRSSSSSSSSNRSFSFPHRLASGGCRSSSRRSRPSSACHSNSLHDHHHEPDEQAGSWSLLHAIKSLLTMQKRRLPAGHGVSLAHANPGIEQQQEDELATTSPYPSSVDQPHCKKMRDEADDGAPPYPGTSKNGTTSRLVERWSRIVRAGTGHGRIPTEDVYERSGCKMVKTKLQQKRSSNNRPNLRESMVTGTLYGRRKGRITLVIQEGPRARQAMAVFDLPMQTNALLKEMATGLVKIALECRLSSVSANYSSTTTTKTTTQQRFLQTNGIAEIDDAENEVDNKEHEDEEDDGAEQDGDAHRQRNNIGTGGAQRLWRMHCKKKQQQKQQEMELLREVSWTMFCNGRRIGFAIRRGCCASDFHTLSLLRGVSMGAGILPAAAAAAAASSSTAAGPAMDSSTNSSLPKSSSASLSSASLSSSLSVSSSFSSSSSSLPVSAPPNPSNSIYCICTAINPSSAKCTCYVNPLLLSAGALNTDCRASAPSMPPSAQQPSTTTRTCDVVEHYPLPIAPFFKLGSSSGHYKIMFVDPAGASPATSSTMAASSVPAAQSQADMEQEHILYMRSSFQRVVGSKDSQAFYMINPDQAFASGPDLSIFFLRLPAP